MFSILCCSNVSTWIFKSLHLVTADYRLELNKKNPTLISIIYSAVVDVIVMHVKKKLNYDSDKKK